jgi:hypothetical protein
VEATAEGSAVTLQRTGLLVGTAIAVILAVALIAQGNPTAIGHPNRAGELEVVVAMRSFEPNHLYLPVEKPLTLTFVNQSDVTHWFSLGREVDDSTGRTTGFVEDLLADLKVRVVPARAVATDAGHHVFSVETGQSITVAFELPADRVGEWELGCFTAAGCYYEYGFLAPVTVE